MHNLAQVEKLSDYILITLTMEDQIIINKVELKYTKHLEITRIHNQWQI